MHGTDTQPSEQIGYDMTATHEIRSRTARYDREERMRREEAKAIIAAIFMLIAFLLAGTIDYQTEQREAQIWQERGITVIRDW